MFKKRMKIEVVPESQYTDFSDRMDESKYATKRTIIAAALPLAVAIPIVVSKLTVSTDTYTATSIPVAAAIQAPPPIPVPQTAVDVIAQTPVEPALNALAQNPSYMPVSSPEFIQTGIIADKSLEALANVMQPLIDILVAVSFPIASVIMIGACFFFMFGNSEKAWSMIMNAGLGYVLIQMSPLFLQMLRVVGESV
ncbi:hypothetical protein [Paenisporosarcina sp. NPDC076898]|uniref:hypothetical protein n=1 Tax=unclassified Paenisporosarcina TaxID=2642018 RepID=UPI003D04B9C7